MNRTKTMLRQVVSLLLSFLMSASLVVPAFAETVDAIYKEGDHVYVDIAFDYINVNGSEGYVGAFDYCVYFDDDCLSLSSSSKKISGMLTLDTSTPGAAAVSAVCDEAPESRVVYTYDFIVTKNTNNIGVFGECTSLTALSLDESERQLLVDPDLGLTDYYSKLEVRVNDNKEKVYHEGDVVSVGIAVGGIKYEGAAAKLATINYELSYDTKVLEFTSDEKHDNGGSIKAVEKNPGLVRIGALSEDGFEQDYSADTTVLYTRSMVVTKDTDNLGIRGMCVSLSGINNDDVPFSLIDGNNTDDTYTKLIIIVDCPHPEIEPWVEEEKDYHEGDTVSINLAIGGLQYRNIPAKLGAMNYTLYYDPDVVKYDSGERHEDSDIIVMSPNTEGFIRISGISQYGFSGDYTSEPLVFYTVNMIVTKDTRKLGVRGECSSLACIYSTDQGLATASLININRTRDIYTSLSINVDCPHTFDSDTGVDSQSDTNTSTGKPAVSDKDTSTEKPATSDKDTSTEKPVTSDKDTSTEKPTTSDKDTSTDKTKPATSDKDTSTDKPKPATSDKDTSTDKPKPTASDKDTSTDKTKPAASDKDTSTDKTKPTASDKDTSTDKTKPATSDKDTSTDKTKPTTSDKDTSTDKPKPATSDKDTSTDYVLSDVDTSTDEKQPDAETDGDTDEPSPADTDTDSDSEVDTDIPKDSDADTDAESDNDTDITDNTDTDKTTDTDAAPVSTPDTPSEDGETPDEPQKPDVPSTADVPESQTDTDNSTDTATSTDTDKSTDTTAASDTDKSTDTTAASDTDKSTDTAAASDTDKSTDTAAASDTDKSTDTTDTSDTDNSTDTETSTDNEKTSDTDEPKNTDDTPTGSDTDTDTEEIIEGDVAYKVLPDDTAIITNFVTEEKEVVIPKTINGKKVTRISANAFRNNQNVESIVISEDVTEIGDNAFENCENLEEVVIPESVTSISASAFLGCSKLILYGAKDSYAAQFAAENNIDFVNMYNLIGDIDEDGQISSADSLKALRASVGLETLGRAEQIYGDVDIDTVIDSNDSLQILRYSAMMSAHENVGKRVKE